MTKILDSRGPTRELMEVRLSGCFRGSAGSVGTIMAVLGVSPPVFPVSTGHWGQQQVVFKQLLLRLGTLIQICSPCLAVFLGTSRGSGRRVVMKPLRGLGYFLTLQISRFPSVYPLKTLPAPRHDSISAPRRTTGASSSASPGIHPINKRLSRSLIPRDRRLSMQQRHRAL